MCLVVFFLVGVFNGCFLVCFWEFCVLVMMIGFVGVDVKWEGKRVMDVLYLKSWCSVGEIGVVWVGNWVGFVCCGYFFLVVVVFVLVVCCVVMSVCFFWFVLLFFDCFCEVCFCMDFGDLLFMVGMFLLSYFVVGMFVFLIMCLYLFYKFCIK